MLIRGRILLLILMLVTIMKVTMLRLLLLSLTRLLALALVTPIRLRGKAVLVLQTFLPVHEHLGDAGYLSRDQRDLTFTTCDELLDVGGSTRGHTARPLVTIINSLTVTSPNPIFSLICPAIRGRINMILTANPGAVREQIAIGPLVDVLMAIDLLSFSRTIASSVDRRPF